MPAMKRAAFSLVLFLLASCGGPPPNLDSPGKTIVCLGDSITAGVGAAPEESYPARLAEPPSGSAGRW
jgi:lysophospholipase L1-like esterase